METTLELSIYILVGHLLHWKILISMNFSRLRHVNCFRMCWGQQCLLFSSSSYIVATCTYFHQHTEPEEHVILCCSSTEQDVQMGKSVYQELLKILRSKLAAKGGESSTTPDICFKISGRLQNCVNIMHSMCFLLLGCLKALLRHSNQVGRKPQTKRLYSSLISWKLLQLL